MVTPDQKSHTRRAAATIAFADVVGFTAMTAEDELGTHKTWSDFQSACLRPAIDQSGGQLVKMLGDGVLVVFDDAAAAADWALRLQEDLARDRANETHRWPRLRLRIGLHRGDVIFEGGDVHGGTVNIAKRVQEVAAPDSIVLTAAAAGELPEPVATRMGDLGYMTLKGDPTPIRAYGINPTGGQAATVRAQTQLPTLAVMPFETRGRDDDDRYFADGFVEDIITSLSCLHDMRIIARSSTLAFRDRQLNPQQAMDELGARYVLQGSLRHRNGDIRVSTALIDCVEATTLFSTARDLRQDNLYEEHDRLTRDVVRELAPQIQRQEVRRAMRKPTHVFTAYDHALRALHEMRSLRRSGYRAARAHLDAAILADADYAMPYALLCQWHTMMIGQGWHSDRVQTAIQAEDAARKALERDNNNVLALCYYGHVKAFLLEDFDTAQLLHERSLNLGPSHAPGWMLASATKAYLGAGDEAVAYAERALELSPIDLDLFQFYAFLAFAQFSNRDFEAAVFWSERSRSENAQYTSNLKLMAGALAVQNQLEDARKVVEDLLVLEPGYRVSSYEGTLRPFRDAGLRTLMMDALRRAGVPD